MAHCNFVFGKQSSRYITTHATGNRSHFYSRLFIIFHNIITITLHIVLKISFLLFYCEFFSDYKLLNLFKVRNTKYTVGKEQEQSYICLPHTRRRGRISLQRLRCSYEQVQWSVYCTVNHCLSYYLLWRFEKKEMRTENPTLNSLVCYCRWVGIRQVHKYILI